MRFFALDPDPAQGRAVAAAGGFRLDPHEMRPFEGGEHKGRPLVPVAGERVAVLAALHAHAGLSTNDLLMRLLFFVAACRDHGAASVAAICPLMPYARKDRRTKPLDPVGARYVAQLFEAVGARAVATVEVHQPAAFDSGFRIPALRLDLRAALVEHIRAASAGRPVALVSPDLGGAKRVQLLAESFPEPERSDLALGFCEKRRSEGVVSGDLFAGDVAGRDVWIVDDMIVGGGTMRRAIATVRAAGARQVRLAATHALFAPATLDSLLEAGCAGVTVSDTTAPLAEDLRGRRGLDILPVAPLLAEAAGRLTAGPEPGGGRHDAGAAPAS